jgi:hypothetical protein
MEGEFSFCAAMLGADDFFVLDLDDILYLKLNQHPELGAYPSAQVMLSLSIPSRAIPTGVWTCPAMDGTSLGSPSCVYETRLTKMTQDDVDPPPLYCRYFIFYLASSIEFISNSYV